MKRGARQILLSVGLLCFLVVIGLPFVPALTYRVRLAAGTSSMLQAVPTVRRLALPVPGAESASVPRPVPTGDALVIPSIGVEALIRQGNDIGILDRLEGVWHQTGDVAGNYVLAGHRFKYLPPNTQTLYNLDKLGVGDEIELWLGGVKKVYAVRELKTVNNDDVGLLAPTASPQLLIYTCVDLTYQKRLVVIAVPMP